MHQKQIAVKRCCCLMNKMYLQQTRAMLLAYEQVELTSLHHGIEQNAQQTKLINETLARDTKEGQDIEMVAQRLGQIAHASEERSDRMASKTIGQELRDVLNAERELNFADSSVSVKLHQDSVAEIVSATVTHMRGGTLENTEYGPHIYISVEVMMEISICLSSESKVCHTLRSRTTQHICCGTLRCSHYFGNTLHV